MSIETYCDNDQWYVDVSFEDSDTYTYGPFPTKELALFFVRDTLENE